MVAAQLSQSLYGQHVEQSAKKDHGVRQKQDSSSTASPYRLYRHTPRNCLRLLWERPTFQPPSTLRVLDDYLLCAVDMSPCMLNSQAHRATG